MHSVCKSVGIILINRFGCEKLAQLVISTGCDFTNNPLIVSSECICNCKWLNVLLRNTNVFIYDGHEKLEYILKIVSAHSQVTSLKYDGTFHEHELDLICHTNLVELYITSNVYHLSGVARVLAILPQTRLLYFTAIIPLHLRTKKVHEAVYKLDPTCIWNFYDPRSESDAYEYIENNYKPRVSKIVRLVKYLNLPVELVRELITILGC